MLLILIFSIFTLSIGDDPEVYMTTVQMAQYWGYAEANVVEVQTEDGYILEMHHIPYGKNWNGSSIGHRPVVFLQHGLLCASDNFVWNLPNQSLAFILADYGFDVWMGNVRGNRYSQKHISLNTTQHEFWKFRFDLYNQGPFPSGNGYLKRGTSSWDEMAKYDLDAMVSKVLDLTGAESLYYAGHSQGTEIMFTKLSIDQEFASKIKAFFALAPVGTVKNVQGALGFLARNLTLDMDLLFHLMGASDFLPQSWLIDILAEVVCGDSSYKKFGEKIDGQEFCDNIFFLVGGINTEQLNTTRTPVYISHAPAGTSTQDMIHWMQMVLSGKQQAYDYGSSTKNFQHYNSTKPPIYNISLVNVPTYLYWSDEDWLADPQDVQDYILANLNSNILKGNFHLKGFNHLDYIFGLRAADEIYHPIARIIQQDFF